MLSATTATCTGDLSSGVSYTSEAVDTLDVNTLTADIEPASGDAGVSFKHAGKTGDDGLDVVGGNADNGDSVQSVTINYTGGSQNIVTHGEFAFGLFGLSAGGKGGTGGEGDIQASGGNGGNGGNSGGVDIEASGAIKTSGSNSHGILALSQGGDAGIGGNSKSVDATGGHGGEGGSAGTVTVTYTGTIETNDTGAQGILAQGLGGAGGDGGTAGGIVATGGFAGASTVGGQVTVNSSGSIVTWGAQANGILVQSIGGFGGDGGGGSGLFAGSADGIKGAGGGTAKVENSASITTHGSTAYGILAQSIGGDGGRAESSSGIAAIGGDGAGGGTGGNVSVTNRGVITTGEDVSIGILAQSVGGGGGDGGSSTGIVSIGGKAADGATGGSVTVKNTGDVLTAGDGALGILTQSIGGGGGHGGDSTALVSIGGQSGGGGDGHTIQFENSGDISTTGDRADAIHVQSVGGGGGTGGASTAGGIGFSIAIGGAGGVGGQGGNVFFNPTLAETDAGATVTTTGEQSMGAVAHSIGGGGGSGGWSLSASAGLFDVAVGIGGTEGGGGDGGEVHMRFKGTVETHGSNGIGLNALSVGGGGGSGGASLVVSPSIAGSFSLGLGGNGSLGGAGGPVDLTSWTDITTHGEHSAAISAASIGGGGGNGGNSISGSLSALADMQVSLGGKPGTGGSASTVTVSSTGKITTTHAYSHGILAQSIAGGGGSGGTSVAAGASGLVSASVSVGGDGGLGGNADTVGVSSSGIVSTSGDKSHGVVAQSIGGGGGTGGFSVSASVSTTASVPVSIGGNGFGGGNGSSVTIKSDGTVVTSGQGSHALFAQSLGGGGGDGGFSIAAGLTLNPVADVTAGVSIGGNSETGGGGGAAKITYAGVLRTTGNNASAIVAQSIGGTGGNGGFSVDGGLSFGGDFSADVGVSVGGKGGGGGAGSTVEVDNLGTIWTDGKNANGVLAQSIGGGGGNGGFSVTGAVSISAGASVTANVAVGDSGGNAGTSDTVTVKHIGAIRTGDDHSAGLFAQSIGGSGGHGGFSVSGDLAAGQASGSVGVSVGGGGGTAANGNDVKVESAGNMQTKGASSAAIAAQSIGGGGGNGGFSVGGAMSFGADAAASAGVSVGGVGGGAGGGGAVTVINGGILSTGGDNSAAIAALSLGGGGGSGGFSVAGTLTVGGDAGAGVGVSIGGKGSGGGNASTVEINSVGALVTTGRNSTGIVAQSIGGGGGHGGFGIAGGMTIGGDAGASVGVNLGGGGGGGGAAEKVTVVSDGLITTSGDGSSAIVATSIGGSGGSGGFSVTGSLDFSGDFGGSADVSVGGTGGSGGNGASVELVSIGTRQTAGQNASGIVAQSIGGGGGNGGFSVAGSLAVSGGNAVNANVSVGSKGGQAGSSSSVTVENDGNISTDGGNAAAVFAQSVAGSGGHGGFAVTGGITAGGDGGNLGVSVGGTGGAGSTSSAVTVGSIGDIVTVGENSAGIHAQSIGGTGGHGGFSVTGGIAAGGDGGDISVGVGGSGGTGAHGGDVHVDSLGSVRTTGNSSTGIFVQSVGGGGGSGGFSVVGGIDISGDGGNVGVSIGGGAAQGADSGNVTLIHIGDVGTQGNNALGIFAQSVGGGGGNGGFSAGFDGGSQADVTVSVGGGAGNGGDADTVTVDSAGTITTAGMLAHGVLAKSVGGSGGNGGFSIAGSLSTKGSVSATVGGSGGDGGIASTVSLNHLGSVATGGSGSHALFAQSIGGSGGNGGFSGAADITFKGDANIGVTVGGGGGTGKQAGAVSVISLDGEISTAENGAIGIFAQSIGGGGGDGGFSFSANLGIANGDGPTTNIGVAVGGGGGEGGTGSTVDLINENRVVTVGDQSSGLLAQSIGGSGGRGGFAVSGAVNLSTSKSRNLNVSVGGGGGSGNTADTVTVDNSGSVFTQGGQSRALFAQSVGGGGGNGGLAFSGTLAGGGTKAAPKNIEVSIGGSGGTGGDGGVVDLSNEGLLHTTGYLSEGILAQSVGGGGGAGGLAGSAILSYTGNGTNLNITVAVGGTGGAGGTGNDVTVANEGLIVTEGVGSAAIHAQSVGGGGGNGGSAFGAVVGFTKPGSDNPEARNLTIDVGIGGDAGDGSTGGAVEIINRGALVTSGGSSRGIFAQSIGGGGGSGGAADAFSMDIGSCSNPLLPGCETPELTDKSMDIEVSVGGSGGVGGDGDTVTVKNHGAIWTNGANADAIFAQSIGAGGGEGGNGDLGQTAVTGLPADIIDGIDTFLNPPVLFWQEIDVSVGGSNGASGNGGTVIVTNSRVLTTQGVRSSGIFAQSVGGGGGQGGNSSGVFFGVAIGGSSGAAGDGGIVTIGNTGDITTTGDGSMGIFAQSVGGGGGVSGWVDQEFLGTGASLGIGVTYTNDGGFGGNGGDVEVTTSAVIYTTGAGAHGVWAQSVGGGGGLAGTGGSAVGLNFAGSTGADGDGGNVTVDHRGFIYTSGDGAVGIFAQSASGGADGNTGDATDVYAVGATGSSGTVSVTVNSGVISTGDGARAIVMQSVGLNGNEDLQVDIGSTSEIVGGSDSDGAGIGLDPVAILLLDGADNVVNTDGIVTTVAGVEGTAIRSMRTFAGADNTTQINDTVNNGGTMTGSVYLGGTSNSLTNLSSGIMYTGTDIDLGSDDNVFENYGIVSPGGPDNIVTTQVTGTYHQFEDAVYLVDLDFADNAGANASDRIEASGDVLLDGEAVMNALNGAFLEPDQSGEVLILEPTGPLEDLSFEARDTAAVSYSLRYDEHNDLDVYLSWDVDYAPDGLNANQDAIGNYLMDVVLAGDPLSLNEIYNAVLEAPDTETLANQYGQLSPEPYMQAELETARIAMQFSSFMHDCPRHGALSSDGGCAWLSPNGQVTNREASHDAMGYSARVQALEGGFGGNLDDRLSATFAFSMGQQKIETESFATSFGHQYQAGASIRYSFGDTIVSASGFGGIAQFDVSRLLTLTGERMIASAEQRLAFGGAEARLAHNARFGSMIVKPQLSVWAGYFHHDAVIENGAGGAGLNIEAGDDFVAAMRPSLTVSADFALPEGGVARPYARGGLTYFLSGSNTVRRTANLQGEDALVPGFSVSDSFAELYLDAEIGLGLMLPTGAALSFGGIAQYSENSTTYGGSAKFVLPF